MRRALVVLLVVAAAAAAALGAEAGSAAAGRLAREAMPVKIVCFGDSITFGYKASNPLTASYPAFLQRMLEDKYGMGRFTVVNAGISGEDTRQGLKRLDALLASEKPDWVLVEYGTNDLWTGRKIAPAETKANLLEMIRRMKAAGARVILATLPPVGDEDKEVAERNAVIREAAREADVPVNDLNAAFEKALADAGGKSSPEAWAKYYAPEETWLHPNDYGDEFLAGLWMKALEAAGALPEAKPSGKAPAAAPAQ